MYGLGVFTVVAASVLMALAFTLNMGDDVMWGCLGPAIGLFSIALFFWLLAPMLHCAANTEIAAIQHWQSTEYLLLNLISSHFSYYLLASYLIFQRPLATICR